MGKRTSFYLTDDTMEKLRISEENGHGTSAAITEVIDRYQTLIGYEKPKVKALFSESEWNAMFNACNGTIWQPAATIRGGALANIEDSLDQEITEYGAVRSELESKLRSLSALQQFALIEIIEDFWHEVSTRP